ncbi:hypothetical protein PG993_008217 [Apiospora rasikravindrae]|uniref:Uncharacterized protein n=1 Tax=Apiospora rasikravindrae TaxID=990691 RepID=A0ABR1SZQ5_9PEZI
MSFKMSPTNLETTIAPHSTISSTLPSSTIRLLFGSRHWDRRSVTAMAPRRTLIKKLYQRLRTNQVEDDCLTAFQFVEIKFYLKNHKRCHHIVIRNDLPLDYLACSLPDNLPKFISSQLEAQRLIADDHRLSVQVWSVIHTISGCFSRDPSHTRSYPTLFYWRSPNKQRSYYLFAYLTRAMTTRKYKASELLDLRDIRPCQDILDRVQKNPDVADIVTGFRRNSILSDSSNVAMSRRPKKIKEEASSTDSEDQVLFQGRKAPPRPSVTNGDATSDPKPPRRNEPDRTEPLSAPTGLAAQQSEGFQRFFKAVVSPTHVRVTAGGRIVPNTRSTASPTAKWDKDLPNSEIDSNDIGKSSQIDQQVPVADPATCQTAPPVMAPPMASPMYPGFPAMYPPMAGHMPFYPHPMAGGMGFPYSMPYPPMQMPAMASGSQNAMPQAQAPQQSENPTTGSKPENRQESRKPKPAPLKLSPPEQFDQNRPFYYNGHFIYPPMGSGHMQSPLPPMTPSPCLPPGFAGHPVHPGLPGHPALARVGSFAQPSSVSSLPSPHVMPAQTSMPLTASAAMPQPVAPQSQGASKSSASSHFPSSAKPPPSSIKPSDITKVQLGSLRSQLKYYEDQLQYNKHQIDEEKTKDQVGAIRQLIVQFEHNCGMQMHFETSQYSGSDAKSTNETSKSGTEAAPCQTPSRESSMQESDDVSVPQVPDNSATSSRRGNPTLAHTQSMDQIRPRTVKERRQAAGINSSKGNDTSAALDALVARLSMAGEDSKTSSSFIPPAITSSFGPSRTSSLSMGNPAGIEANTNSMLHNSMQLESGSSFLPPQQSPWQDFGSYVAGARPPTHPGLGHHPVSTSSYATPYLVGVLPRGITPQAARSADYVYARELTEEEKRARHIYWGQVSIKGSGLPKFDGKDFYPPTPTKEVAPDSEQRKKLRGMLPTGRPEVDFGFAKPKKTTGDPFHAGGDKGSGKVSHAVPIINPETRDPLECAQTPKASNGTKSSAAPTSDQKAPSPSRRIPDRSSNKSSNDLWHSMLKKGTASGVAVPRTVSSTTATGYVPPLSSHGTASLAPALVNANGHATRSLLGKAEQDPIGMPAEKVGENRPPQQQTLKQQDDIADLHQRMLRDAERRGINWQ